ncbi:MAG: hypothetical protein JEZ07_15080 [Phycisphaerae bacterium]|nr:hypothetical protein [Phycisphaerae bacterium]
METKNKIDKSIIICTRGFYAILAMSAFNWVMLIYTYNVVLSKDKINGSDIVVIVSNAVSCTMLFCVAGLVFMKKEMAKLEKRLTERI